MRIAFLLILSLNNCNVNYIFKERERERERERKEMKLNYVQRYMTSDGMHNEYSCLCVYRINHR